MPVCFNQNQDLSRIKKTGMLLADIGLGILFGNIVAVKTTIVEPSAYFYMIFLFTGISLILSYFIDKKKEN